MSFSRTVLFFFSLIFAVNLSTASFRILGGDRAADKQFPQQAALINPEGELFCGGSIIKTQWILTAARCFENIRPPSYGSIKVSVGSLRWRDGAKHSVQHVCVHENYATSKPFLNDIAMVKLSDRISFSENVKMVPMNPSPVAVGSSLIISGWGFDDTTTNVISDVLKYATVQSFDLLECAVDLYDTPSDLMKKLICTTTERGEAMCNRDQGSGLLLNGELVGIASFYKGQNCKEPNVFTAIYEYIDWVEEVTVKNSSSKAKSSWMTSLFVAAFLFTPSKIMFKPYFF